MHASSPPLQLAPVGRLVAARIARRHHLSPGAVEHVMETLAAEHGARVHFDHPEFGGPLEWPDDARADRRVEAVCAEVSAALAAGRGMLLWS